MVWRSIVCKTISWIQGGHFGTSIFTHYVRFFLYVLIIVTYVYIVPIIHEYTQVEAAPQHVYGDTQVYQALTIEHGSRNRIFINGKSPCAIWETHGLF